MDIGLDTDKNDGIVAPALGSSADLPVHGAKDKLMDLIRKNRSLVLVGETGSGKTTQVPQFLLDCEPPLPELSPPDRPAKKRQRVEGSAPVPRRRLIGVTQPRRVAATTIAQRVAAERGVRLGGEVGYAVRFDDCSSKSTLLKYMTDGILLREILSDPMLDNYGVIILDEAHERTLHGDVLFGLLKSLYGKRKDLRIIVMSATLDVRSFSSFWEGAPIGQVRGRQFPVSRWYTERPQVDYVDAAVTCMWQIHDDEQSGDILIFLTGQEEIDVSVDQVREEALEREKSGDLRMKVLPLSLYSSLPPKQQLEVFKPAPKGSRKVIFATNIAETSITISGIRYVIDCGMVKMREFSPETGLELLQVSPISQAQARQRAGRAGREFAGRCYRLYTEEAFQQFPKVTVPEIQRANLASVVLHLKHLGIHDVIAFPFMDPPTVPSMVQALESLLAIGALDKESAITPMGRALSLYPLEPMHAKCMIHSLGDDKVHYNVAAILALLSIENIFYCPSDKKEEADARKMVFSSPYGDHLTLLKVFEEYARLARDERERKRLGKWASTNFINLRSLLRAEEVLTQLLALREDALKELGKGMDEKEVARLTQMDERDTETRVRQCFAAAFFPLAARWDSNRKKYQTLNGREYVSLHPSSVMYTERRKPEYVIYNSLVHTSQKFMRDVVAVDEAWLLHFGKFMYKGT